MDNSGSIVEFFYNIVPSALFLLLLLYFGIFNYDLKTINDGNAVVVIFIFLVISLFLGFLLQAITMVFRRFLGWNNRNFNEVKRTNPIYKTVEKTFSKDNPKIKSDNYEKIFYLMDAGLRSERRAFLPTHFSSLFAFWSNTLFAGGFLILIVFTRELYGSFINPEKSIPLVFITGVTYVSWFFADKLLKSFYESILNSYYMKFVKNENKS